MDESPGEGEGEREGTRDRERQRERERIKNNMHVSEIYFFGVHQGFNSTNFTSSANFKLNSRRCLITVAQYYTSLLD
jgi:hypothetical protein